MPIPAESRITAVTVFLDRAKVTRAARVLLPAGESTVVIADVPTRIDVDSVRASGRGPGTRIIGLDVPSTYHSETPDAEAGALQDKAEALLLEQRECNDRTAVEEQRQKMTAALRASGASDLVKGLAWGRATIDSIQALSKYADAEDASSRAAVREIDARLKSIAKELGAIRKRQQQIQQNAQTSRLAIHIDVEADAADTFLDLEVTYVCDGATWSPLYDVRLLGDKVSVTYLAMITQATGEAWADVDLALSTARPAVTTEIPELEPWYLDLYAPPPPPIMAAPASQMMRGSPPKAAEFTAMFSAGGGAPMAPPPPEAEIVQATPGKQGASVTFRMARKTSIPSDRTPHRAQIAELELPATLDYITAPIEAEQAYLRAKIQNNSGFVLLPGKANLFHGDEYVGTTELEDTASKEFELQMGVDERVSVTRELVSRDVSKAFIGNTRKTQYAYRIRIANQLERASRITVLDQIPHSRHEEIKVKLLDATPKVAEQTDLSELHWRLMLEPGRAQDIQFSFSIEFPKQMRVLGLPD
jgi:uncharacterized protein (TIGR02231 family)